MIRELTIVIPARNASGTIERAVASARAESPSKILLVDHASTDDTVVRAQRAGGDALDVVSAPGSAALGAVRQTGLEAVRTEFGMWLDADDELVPGRAERLLARLESGPADLAFDEVDLHDASTGEWLRRLPIPSLLGERQMVRLFERNYLPGLGVPAFRTCTAAAVGYDPALHGGEDFDFVLRSLVAGHRIALVRKVGYRQFASASTISRDIDNQTSMARAALRKHDPREVEARFRRSGYSDRTTAWGMIAFLTMRGDYEQALAWLDAVPTGSRRDFHVGTLLAALGRHAEAIGPLERAFYEAGTPELLNNFGVTLAALNRITEATSLFGDALREFPDYKDASANLLSERPSRLTLLPLRREPARNEY